jgi:hypothetical protein
MTKIEGLTKNIFVIATVPEQIPHPSLEQNDKVSVDINCVTNDFIGFDTAVAITSAG